MAEQDKVLPWLKWHTKDVINYREVFNVEQMGELFFAVMKTVESGERQEVSTEIKFAYLQLCTYVDESRAAYFKKCETNAINGSKGGKAKAAKGKVEEEAKEDEIKPPSKTDFRNMAKHICREYELQYDAYNVDELFDRLNRTQWCVKGKSLLKAKYLILAIIYSSFSTDIVPVEIFFEALERGYDMDIDMIQEMETWHCSDGHYRVQNYNFSTIQEALEYYFKDEK